MFPCPHCHKTIEIGIAPDGKVPWYKYDPGNPKVGLGCGTLLAIGIIVALCSGGFGTQRELEHMQRDIDRLSDKLGEIQASIDRLAPQPSAVAPPKPSDSAVAP